MFDIVTIGINALRGGYLRGHFPRGLVLFFLFFGVGHSLVRAQTQQPSPPLTPQERLEKAQSRVDEGNKRIQDAQQMISEGEAMYKSGKRSVSVYTKQLKEREKMHAREADVLLGRARTEDKEERAVVREEMKDLKEGFRRDTKEIKGNLKGAMKEQRNGEKLQARGKKKLKKAKEFLAAAKAKLKETEKQNREREAKLLSIDRRR